MTTKSKTKTRQRSTTRTRARARREERSARETRTERHTRQSHEHRERMQRAKRALRALKARVLFPRAVIHTNKMRLPTHQMMEEIPQQALIEHWEAMGELKQRGIEVLATEVRNPEPHLGRAIELDYPVSSHARHFASRHGLEIRERRGAVRSTLERIFG